MILGESIPEVQHIVNTESGNKILYSGLSHKVSNSQLTFPILTGSETSYTIKTTGSNSAKNQNQNLYATTDTLLATGSNVGLVSAMQARNSARVVFAGSDMLCSNEYYKLNNGNGDSEPGSYGPQRHFCSEVSKWVFREKLVLRMSNLQTHKVDEPGIRPHMYRVMDDIVFKIDINEWKDRKWVPYVRPDIQLDFVMLDPHIRKFLTPPDNNGTTTESKSLSSTYSTTFKTPDVYGVFKFKILYSRLGYNVLHVEDLMPVRNFKHNDYERFIWAAAPYYASCLVVPLMVVILSVFFLYHEEKNVGVAGGSSGRRVIPVTGF